MRYFFNAIIDTKRKFPQLLPLVYQIMDENGWEEKRRLFFLDQLSETENVDRMPHSMMNKAFPMMRNFWAPQVEEDGVVKERYGHFSNFPDVVDGVPVFPPSDEITREVLCQIGAKIPNPYSFWQTFLALDGVGFYPDSNLEPILDWRSVQRHPDQRHIPASVWEENFFGIDEEFYQGNLIAVWRGSDWKSSILVRIELTEAHPRAEAIEVVRKFREAFEPPRPSYTKFFTIAVPSGEQREALQKKKAVFQAWLNDWHTQTIARIRGSVDKLRETLSEDGKELDERTIKKRFAKKATLQRHELLTWDDYGWCKRVEHNFWFYAYLNLHQTDADGYYFPDDAYNCLRLRCFGENFNVEAQVEMNKLMKDSWKVMSHLLPDAYAQYVLYFEKEAVPKLAEVFGDTSPVFYQESFTWDWRWKDGILVGGRRG
ncbi:MAG: hypothetical protein IJ716_17340 [Lachnospiraceae bacterium]|nr:hypothetical protein [Lachnospiraceae bacterium]